MCPLITGNLRLYQASVSVASKPPGRSTSGFSRGQFCMSPDTSKPLGARMGWVSVIKVGHPMTLMTIARVLSAASLMCQNCQACQWGRLVWSQPVTCPPQGPVAATYQVIPCFCTTQGGQTSPIDGRQKFT